MKYIGNLGDKQFPIGGHLYGVYSITLFNPENFEPRNIYYFINSDGFKCKISVNLICKLRKIL